MYERYEKLTITRSDNILTVSIDNPPLNEITTQVDIELSEIFIDINRDPSVNVVVLTAGGDRIFCAGGSLDDLIEAGKERDFTVWVAGKIGRASGRERGCK